MIRCIEIETLFQRLEYISFLICYLAALRPTLDHSTGDSLTQPILIATFNLYLTRRSLGASWRGWVPKPAGSLRDTSEA